MSFRIDQRAFNYQQLMRSVRGFVQGHPQLIDTGAIIRQGVPGASPFPAAVGAGEIFMAFGPLAQTGRLRATVTTGGGNDVAQFSLAYTAQGSPPAPLSPDFQSPVFPSFAGTLVANQEFQENDIHLAITSSVNWVVGNVIDMDIVPTTNTTPWLEQRFIDNQNNSPNFSGEMEWITSGPGDGSPRSNITIGVRTQTSGGSVRNIELNGFDAFTSTSPETAYASQPNISPSVFMLLNDQAMDYHITVNSRRFIVMAEISSGRWANCYAGFFLPYAGDVSYPYPIMVAADTTTSGLDASATGFDVGAFWDPESLNASIDIGGFYLREPSGLWRSFWHREAGSTSTTSIDNVIWPWGQSSQINAGPYFNTWLGVAARTITFTLGTSPDPDLRGYNPLQAVLFSVDFAGGVAQTLGFLDGVFHVTGENNAGGNTFPLESPVVTMFITQNSFKSTRKDFAAIRMDP